MVRDIDRKESRANIAKGISRIIGCVLMLILRTFANRRNKNCDGNSLMKVIVTCLCKFIYNSDGMRVEIWH